MDAKRLLGASVVLSDELPSASLFFGEAQGRIILSCAPANLDRVLKITQKHGVPERPIGQEEEVNSDLSITGTGTSLRMPVEHLSQVWRSAIPRLMEG